MILLTAGRPETVADLLCHEASHIRIQPVLALDPLVQTAPDKDAAGFESPWRPDPRPIRGVLLGVHAFLNVCAFYRRIRQKPAFTQIAQTIHARQKTKVEQGYAILRAHGVPTRLGQDLMARLAQAMDELGSPEAA